MLNKIFLILFIILLSSFLYAAENNTSVEVSGISIIGKDFVKAREKAFNNAFEKAIFKVCQDNLNIDNITEIEQVITDPEKYIDGYEIIEENQEGNILNERLKVFVNLKALLKAFKKNISQEPVYVISTCINVADNSTDNFCTKSFQNKLKLLPDIIEITPASFNSIFSEPKDLLVIITYKIISSRRIFSIAKEFDNLSFTVQIYNSTNQLLKSFVKNIQAIADIDKSPTEYLPEDFFSNVLNYVSKKCEEISAEKSKQEETASFYLIVTATNFMEVRNIERLMQNYNVDFNLEQIAEGKFYYLIKGISKDEFSKILKFSRIQFKSFKIDSNITVNF